MHYSVCSFDVRTNVVAMVSFRPRFDCSLLSGQAFSMSFTISCSMFKEVYKVLRTMCGSSERADLL